jgi:hypothetical protein
MWEFRLTRSFLAERRLSLIAGLLLDSFSPELAHLPWRTVPEPIRVKAQQS